MKELYISIYSNAEVKNNGIDAYMVKLMHKFLHFI